MLKPQPPVLSYLEMRPLRKSLKLNKVISNFPGDQWLRLCVPNEEDVISIPGRGTKIPHTATKSSHAVTKDFESCN